MVLIKAIKAPTFWYYWNEDDKQFYLPHSTFQEILTPPDIDHIFAALGNYMLARSDVVEWLKENNFKFDIPRYNQIEFETEEDALAFKLRWL